MQQLTPWRNRAIKNRDALKAEAETIQAQLDSLLKQVGDLEHDLALVQQEMTQLVGQAAGVNGGSAKRGGEPPSGLQLIKEALEAPEAALTTPATHGALRSSEESS